MLDCFLTLRSLLPAATGNRLETLRFKAFSLFPDERFETRLKTYTCFTAQIIQHEIDHSDGVLI